MKTTEIANNSELDQFVVFAKNSKFADRIGGNNCVSYVRVSSKEQELGFSLETQNMEHSEAIKREGFNCLGVFGGKYESAKTDERKEFNRMLKFVRNSKQKISYIVVSDVTRFSRSGANAIYIAEQLRKENIKIYSVNNPADTNTATGKMQQNMQFIFAQYDNDLKREKIISSGTQMLSQGYWCTKAPLGYTQVTRHKRYNTDLPVRQIITINETGQLIKKAFYWKAVDKLSNAQILHKLESLGLKLRKQKLDKIFANPFYCGVLAHNWLNGQVVEGKHEKLVSKEIFLLANNMRARNSTWKHNKDFEKIPLKNYMKCEFCGTSYCGYLVKKKNLWYYKCNKTGCKCNKSAKIVNSAFEEQLTRFSLPEKYVAPVKLAFYSYCSEKIKESVEDVSVLTARLNETEAKISSINERFAIGEITRDLYTEYGTKFKTERAKIKEEIDGVKQKNSNLEKRIEKYLQILVNPAQLWVSNSYLGKLELQQLMFPQGITYNHKNGTFRTPEINEVAYQISTISGSLEGKNKGDVGLYNLTSPSVPGTRLELVRLRTRPSNVLVYQFQHPGNTAKLLNFFVIPAFDYEKSTGSSCILCF